jgi:4-amino-4-deoxy-L-arabinose transferase-like glycosyltransferase
MPRRERLLDSAAAAVVLVVYVTVQLLFLLGPQPYDSAKYFRTAILAPHLQADLWTLRIGLIAPVRAAVLLFGPSEAALYAVPLLAGLVLSLAVFGMMLLLFRDRVLAVAAALVTVLNANYLLKSSSIFPDTLATATFTAGFLCLVLGARTDAEQPRDWRPFVFAAAAGVLFGWTYLVREFSPILLPAVAAALVLLRFPVRRAALLVSAAVTTAALELLYGWRIYGDPLVHAHLVLHRSDIPVGETQARSIAQIRGHLGNLFDTLVVFPRLLLAWRVGWLFLLLILLFVIVLAARYRDRRLWLLGSWAFSFWIIMAVVGLGSLSSGRWILNITNVRYWFPVFPAIVMGAFAAVALLTPRRTLVRGVTLVQLLGATLAVVVLVPGLVEFKSCASRQEWVNDPAERWHELRAWFATPQADRYDVVWADRNSFRLLPAYTSTTFGDRLWGGRLKAFLQHRIVPLTHLDRALVLIHKDRFVAPDKVAELEAMLAGLRGEWSPVFVSEDRRMVLLAHTPSPAVPASAAADWWLVTPERSSPPETGTCGHPYVRERQ